MGVHVRDTRSTFAIGSMPDPSAALSASTIITRHWIVPTNIARIPRVVEVVEKRLCQLPLRAEALEMFAIVVSELIQNAFLHAPAGTKTPVEVSMLYVPTVGVFVGVSDAIGPIPRKVLRGTITQVEVFAEHGRGFPLMRKLSSSLFYSQYGQRKEMILGLAANA